MPLAAQLGTARPTRIGERFHLTATRIAAVNGLGEMPVVCDPAMGRAARPAARRHHRCERRLHHRRPAGGPGACSTPPWPPPGGPLALLA
jgi:hypothetical protein